MKVVERLLDRAVRTDDHASVRLLLASENRSMLSLRWIESCFMWSIDRGSTNVVQSFLDPGLIPDETLRSALFRATQYGQLGVVQCLLNTGIDVTPMNTDFLSIKPDDVKFKNISHILVDPSCCEDAPLALLFEMTACARTDRWLHPALFCPSSAGSGIPSRLDHLIPSAPEDEARARIKALSNFQVAILSHALRFQGARRVVYSTCSVWPEEDEGVVMRVSNIGIALLCFVIAESLTFALSPVSDRSSPRRNCAPWAGRSRVGTTCCPIGTGVVSNNIAVETNVSPAFVPALYVLRPDFVDLALVSSFSKRQLEKASPILS